VRICMICLMHQLFDISIYVIKPAAGLFSGAYLMRKVEYERRGGHTEGAPAAFARGSRIMANIVSLDITSLISRALFLVDADLKSRLLGVARETSQVMRERTQLALQNAVDCFDPQLFVCNERDIWYILRLSPLAHLFLQNVYIPIRAYKFIIWVFVKESSLVLFKHFPYNRICTC